MENNNINNNVNATNPTQDQDQVQQYPRYQEQQYYPYQGNPGRGPATASLVLGILSILWILLVGIPGFTLLGLLFGIVALVEAGKASGYGWLSGARTAGMVLGIIGVVFHSIFSLFYILVMGVASTL